MTEKVLWKAGPSYLIILPMALRSILLAFIGYVLYIFCIGNHFDEFMNSNFFLSLIMSGIKSYGLYVLYGLSAYFIYIQYMIVNLVFEVSSQSYQLTKKRLILENSLSGRPSDSIWLSNVYEISVESPFYLKIFNYGYISIYSTEIDSEDIDSKTIDKLFVMASIKNPNQVKLNLVKIIKNIKDKENKNEIIDQD